MSAPRHRSRPRPPRSGKKHAPPAGSRPTPAGAAADGSERLQKAMASAGVGSRRHCEELIAAGRVEVDRKVVQELGAKVDPDRQEIRVDGQPLKKTKRVYFLVNKPIGVVSTNFDPSGRPRVIDLFPNIKERLFTVGRLDLSSEGLILVTNDGQLANELAHPRYGVEKTYHVLVAGQPAPEVLKQLRQGIRLAEGMAHVVSAKVKSTLKKSTVLEIVLNEGRNREIRRLLAKIGHKVLRLKRVALGGVRLKDLPPGEIRRLRSDELRMLRDRSAPSRRPQSRPAPGAAEEPSARPAAAPRGMGAARPAKSAPTKQGRPRFKKGRPADARGNSSGGAEQRRGGRPKGRRT